MKVCCSRDPLQYITLGCTCISMYQLVLLKPNTVTLLPSDSYHHRKRRYSVLSIQLLMYITKNENSQIYHVLEDSKYQIWSYILDDHAVMDKVPTDFLFNGCFFHGWIKCYHENYWKPLAGVIFGYMYYTTQQKMDHLKRAGFNVRSKQVHEQITMTKSDTKLADKLLMQLVPKGAFWW